MNETENRILQPGLREEEVSLKGIVLSGELDAYFETTSLVLRSGRELNFVIERDVKGDELFEHLWDLVRVKCFIREDRAGKRTIRINDYQVLCGNTGKRRKAK